MLNGWKRCDIDPCSFRIPYPATPRTGHDKRFVDGPRTVLDFSRNDGDFGAVGNGQITRDPVPRRIGVCWKQLSDYRNNERRLRSQDLADGEGYDLRHPGDNLRDALACMTLRIDAMQLRHRLVDVHVTAVPVQDT